jgi:phosphatidate cytidylyltransferase
MLERVAYGTLAIAILVGVFILDAVIAAHAEDISGPVGELLRRGSVIPVAVVVVLLGGAVELHQLLRMKGTRPFTRFGYTVVAAILLTPWLSAAGWLGLGAVHVEGIYWLVVWLLAACVGLALAVIIRGDPAGTLRDAGTTLLGIIYLGFLGSFALQLRCGRDMPEQTGVWLLLMVILIAKVSDIGAYFVGSLMGRHKLVSRLSPGKTVEGALGGLLASAVVAVLIMSVGPAVVRSTSPPGSRLQLTFHLLSDSQTALSIVHAATFGLIVSLSGQLGDIIESSFKRDASVKDSGRLMPGFGGILDLTDSPILAVPVGWFLLTAVWRIV